MSTTDKENSQNEESKEESSEEDIYMPQNEEDDKYDPSTGSIFHEKNDIFMPGVLAWFIWISRGMDFEFECKSYKNYPKQMKNAIKKAFGGQVEIRVSSNRIHKISLADAARFALKFSSECSEWIVKAQNDLGIVGPNDTNIFPMDHSTQNGLQFTGFLSSLSDQIEDYITANDFDNVKTGYNLEQVSAITSAYEVINIIAGLVFSFAASLAAGFARRDHFINAELTWPFHLLISFCIGCGLHCIAIFSWIHYEAHRNIAINNLQNAIEFVKRTHGFRQHARISFSLMMLSFIGSLCILFFDGLDWRLALINTLMLLSAICIVVYSIHLMRK